MNSDSMLSSSSDHTHMHTLIYILCVWPIGFASTTKPNADIRIHKFGVRSIVDDMVFENRMKQYIYAENC